MFRLLFIIITIAIGPELRQLSTPESQPQKRPVHGPVVTAYLTNLAEELNELEYQLRHREISRNDYDRAKQRLTIQRRYVERHASQSNEDIVPEYLILTVDEFGMLGLNRKPDPKEINPGEIIGGLWKLIGVEQPRLRFFVFERVPDKSLGGAIVAERKLSEWIDPRSVIETVVIAETATPTTIAQNQPDQATSTPPTENSPSPPKAEKSERPASPTPSPPAPRILHIYLPQYTSKARAQGIEGELIVRALFQRDGKIKNIKVEKELGYGLEQKAIEAVRKIGFQPAQESGREIDAPARIVFNFTLLKVTAYVQAGEQIPTSRGVKK